MKTCNNCGQIIPDKPQPKQMAYTHEGVKYTADLIPYNDAFYEVVSGRHKGNLVHTFNVIKI